MSEHTTANSVIAGRYGNDICAHNSGGTTSQQIKVRVA